MFFDSVDEIVTIASRAGCSIFVLPSRMLHGNLPMKNAILLQPDEKSVITIEQVREKLLPLSMRQLDDQFVVICPVEQLSDAAANALLKNLEEPREKVHFVLLTSEPSKILATILSRAEIYFLREKKAVDGEIVADAKVKEIAKRLIVARPSDVPAIAEEISKKKDGVRAYALAVLAVTIEMLYKSYFKIGKDVFVRKLPKFLFAYENIEKNGHVKLHLVADLI